MGLPLLLGVLGAIVVKVHSQFNPFGFFYPGYGGESPSQEGAAAYPPYPGQQYYPPGYGQYGAADANTPEVEGAQPYGQYPASPYGGYQQPGYYPPFGAYPPVDPFANQEASEQPPQPSYPVHAFPQPRPQPKSQLLPQRRPPLSMAIDGAGALPLESVPVGAWPAPQTPVAMPLWERPPPSYARQATRPRAVDLSGPAPPAPNTRPRYRGATPARSSVMTVHPTLPRKRIVPPPPECGSRADPGACCAPPRVCPALSPVEDETGNCSFQNQDATCCQPNKCQMPAPPPPIPFARRRRPAVLRRRPAVIMRHPAAIRPPPRVPQRMPGRV